MNKWYNQSGDKMNIFKKIESLDNLTTTEQILVAFINEHAYEFVNMKPKEIAEATYVSIPTLYRLINKLELDGINELKLEIKAALKDKSDVQIEDIDFPILPSDSHYEAMIKLQDVYEQTIQDTLDLSDPDMLVQASNLMIEAKNIDVYTASANIFFAQNFQFQMQEINENVNVPIADYMQSLCAANSDETHLAIVISFGGRGQGFDSICQILKMNHTPILLITSTQDNPLVKYTDYKIYMSSYENHYHKISSFSTRMTLLYILDTLYAIYFKKNYEKNLKNKIDSYKKMTSQCNEQ